MRQNPIHLAAIAGLLLFATPASSQTSRRTEAEAQNGPSAPGTVEAHLQELRRTIMHFRSDRKIPGSFPDKLDDIELFIVRKDVFRRVMTNPRTSEFPGFIYVKPAETISEVKSFSTTPLVFEARAGAIDPSGLVIYLDGDIWDQRTKTLVTQPTVQRNLWKIHDAIEAYAGQHKGALPDTLDDLKEYFGGESGFGRVITNPRTGAKPGFGYRKPARYAHQVNGNVPVVFEARGADTDPKGLVLYMDGTIQGPQDASHATTAPASPPAR